MVATRSRRFSRDRFGGMRKVCTCVVKGAAVGRKREVRGKGLRDRMEQLRGTFWNILGLWCTWRAHDSLRRAIAVEVEICVQRAAQDEECFGGCRVAFPCAPAVPAPGPLADFERRCPFDTDVEALLMPAICDPWRSGGGGVAVAFWARGRWARGSVTSGRRGGAVR